MDIKNTSFYARSLEASKVFGPIGGAAGFVADVITPLGNFVTVLAIVLPVLTVLLGIVSYVGRSNPTFSSLGKYVPHGLILSLVFGFFGIMGMNSDRGFVADNFEPVANLQSSLFNIEEGMKRVEGKVDKISEGIDDIKEMVSNDVADIDSRLSEIEKQIANGNSITNPKTLEDFLINASIAYTKSDYKQAETMLLRVFRAGYIKYDLMAKYYDVLFNNYNGDEERINRVIQDNKLSENEYMKLVIVEANTKGLAFYVKLDDMTISNPLIRAYLENSKAKSFFVDVQYVGNDQMMKLMAYWATRMISNEEMLGRKIIKTKSLFFDYPAAYKSYVSNSSHTNDENGIWQFYNPKTYTPTSSIKPDVAKAAWEKYKASQRKAQ